MDIQRIFDKINEMLEETDYPVEINDISDLEDFLNDDENTKYDCYDEIEKLYERILEGEEAYEDSDDF